MKDKNGTNIRSGTYIIHYDSTDIFKVTRTGYADCTCCWLVHADSVNGYRGDILLGKEDMEYTLVVPRRMCTPKLKRDQIRLYAALAGFDTEQGEAT